VVCKAVAQEMQILPRSQGAARPRCSTRAASPGWKRIPCRGAAWDAVPPTRPAHFCNLTFRATRSDDTVCYRLGTDGPLGRRSGFWYGRCPSSCQRLGAVRVACGLSGPASADGSVARAISRSRRCFHRAGSVSSWVPPVGRGSWGLDAVGGSPYWDFVDEGGA
jgi:hypothetical protein